MAEWRHPYLDRRHYRARRKSLRQRLLATVCRAPLPSAIFALGFAMLTVGFAAYPGLADITTARVLSRTRSDVRDGCSVVEVNFTGRVQYQSHFPLDSGDDLVIALRLLDPDRGNADPSQVAEDANIPKNLSGLISDLSLNFRGPGQAELHISFRERVAYKIAQGKGQTSVIVAFQDPAVSEECLPRLALAGAPHGEEAAKAATIPRDSSPSEGDKTEMQRLVTDARAALTSGDNANAIRLLSRSVRIPLNDLSPEAQELLGVARERNHQLAHAKAEYEAYLAQFPDSPDAPRVKQRLAALLTAGGRPGTAAAPVELDKAPSDVEIHYGGSFGQQYILDNTVRTISDEFFGTETETDTNQNELQTNLNLFLDYKSGALEGELRFVGSQTLDFTAENDDETRVSELFAELRNTDAGVSFRAGRQNRHGGGVLGRFDGGLLRWKFAEDYELAVVGGLPVRDKSHLPELDAYFLGASVEAEDVLPGLDLTGYAIGQRSSGLNDRRAVGVEARYFDKSVSLFGGIEYDVFFNSLNLAYVNGGYTFEDRSTLNVSFDHRNAPILQTANALQGQTVDTLDELRDLFEDGEIYDLARDRTARSTTGSVAYTHPFDERIQVGLDATVSHFSGTDASGGVPETPSTGIEYYLSGRVSVTSLLTEGDVVTGTLRYSDTSSSRRYRADVRMRYPITREFRISPLIGAEYREGDAFTEKAVNMRLGVDYALRKDVYLEAEVGGRYSRRNDAGGPSNTFDSYVFVGYRIDF